MDHRRGGRGAGTGRPGLSHGNRGRRAGPRDPVGPRQVHPALGRRHRQQRAGQGRRQGQDRPAAGGDRPRRQRPEPGRTHGSLCRHAGHARAPHGREPGPAASPRVLRQGHRRRRVRGRDRRLPGARAGAARRHGGRGVGPGAGAQQEAGAAGQGEGPRRPARTDAEGTRDFRAAAQREAGGPGRGAREAAPGRERAQRACGGAAGRGLGRRRHHRGAGQDGRGRRAIPPPRIGRTGHRRAPVREPERRPRACPHATLAHGGEGAFRRHRQGPAQLQPRLGGEARRIDSRSGARRRRDHGRGAAQPERPRLHRSGADRAREDHRLRLPALRRRRRQGQAGGGRRRPRPRHLERRALLPAAHQHVAVARGARREPHHRRHGVGGRPACRHRSVHLVHPAAGAQAHP